MFRVWLLLSAAWVMAWIIYLIMFGLQGGFKAPRDLLVIPVLLIGPQFASAYELPSPIDPALAGI